MHHEGQQGTCSIESMTYCPTVACVLVAEPGAKSLQSYSKNKTEEDKTQLHRLTFQLIAPHVLKSGSKP